jgi:ribosomal-protein-alanine N-acetyltransferase
MALFGLSSLAPPSLTVQGQGVFLRVPQIGDFPAWAQLREESRSFLTPWEPVWPSDDLTRPGFRRRLRRYADDVRGDHAYPFFIFRAQDEMLVGGLMLANIRRGIVQAGTLGYWVGEAHARNGYMTAALHALLPFAFGGLSLHRVEAACIPTNVPSIRLLEKCGFVREGLARRYLCINGAWQDHYLYGLVNDDPRYV